MIAQHVPVYSLLVLVGVVVTAWIWSRVSRRGEVHDRRLTIIYLAGLAGAFIGAKLAFFLAEGPAYLDQWRALVTGRSITGGLLGGYAAVEIAKRRLRYGRATGDVFAVLVPLSLVLGRLGCLHAGCCPGVACAPSWWTVTDAHGIARWPAAAVELAYNAAFLTWALAATWRGWLPGNRFHVYLIAYGLFRFGHEFLRDDHRWGAGLGGYHVLALAMAGVGAWRFVVRRRRMRSGATEAIGFAPA